MAVPDAVVAVEYGSAAREGEGADVEEVAAAACAEAAASLCVALATHDLLLCYSMPAINQIDYLCLLGWTRA